MSKNPYDVLGVPQNASDDEITRESREEDIPTEIPPMAGILTITHTTDHRTQRCRQCSIISTAETTGKR